MSDQHNPAELHERIQAIISRNAQDGYFLYRLLVKVIALEQVINERRSGGTQHDG